MCCLTASLARCQGGRTALPPGRTPGQARPAARPGCSCRGPGCPRGDAGTTSIVLSLRRPASARSPCGLVPPLGIELSSHVPVPVLDEENEWDKYKHQYRKIYESDLIGDSEHDQED